VRVIFGKLTFIAIIATLLMRILGPAYLLNWPGSDEVLAFICVLLSFFEDFNY